MKQEAKYQILFNQYIREKRLYGYFELKYTENNTFPFSRIETHQYEGLQAGEKVGLVWKLSDQDMRQKPFDSFCTPPLPAYLIIVFRQDMYMIRIGEIVKLREAGLIGITLEKAKELASYVQKQYKKYMSN